MNEINDSYIYTYIKKKTETIECVYSINKLVFDSVEP